MKNKIRLTVLMIALLLGAIVTTTEETYASDYCKYHNYVYKDVENSSFLVYVGLDLDYPLPQRKFSTSIKAKQTAYYKATFNKASGRVWYGPRKNNGMESYIQRSELFGSHRHCSMTE